MPALLDASALLAYIQDEDGAQLVADAVAEGSTAISIVNLAEALGKLAERGENPQTVYELLVARGFLHTAVDVVDLLPEDAVEIGRLRPLTKHLGLSLGDRACIATAKRLEATALTTERIWRDADLPVAISYIRSV